MRDTKNIYLRAAKRIAFGKSRYTCMAIIFEEDGWKRNTKKFSKAFKPLEQEDGEAWARVSGYENDELQDFRVTMLLMAHAMRQTGDI